MKKRYVLMLIALIIVGIGSITIIRLNPTFASNNIEDAESAYRFYYSYSSSTMVGTRWCITNVIFALISFGLMIRMIMIPTNDSQENGYTLTDKLKVASAAIVVIGAIVIFSTSNFAGGFDNITLSNPWTIFFLSLIIIQIVLIKASNNQTVKIMHKQP